MADFDLIVGVDSTLSYGPMRKGISEAIKQINENPPKIKIDVDEQSKQNIKSFASEIKSELKGLNLKGGKGKVFGDIQTEIANMSTSLESLKTEISSVGQAFKSIKGININLGLGGGDQKQRDALYKQQTKRTLESLQAEAKELEAAFLKVYQAQSNVNVDGMTAVLKQLKTAGVAKNDILDTLRIINTPPDMDPKITKSMRMDAWKSYIGLMRDLANVRGIDISGVMDRNASALVSSTEKIATGESHLEFVIEKIKNLFGSGISSDALAEQINTIVTAIDRVVEAVSKISIDKDAFGSLTNSVQTSTTAVNGLVEALNRINEASLHSKALSSNLSMEREAKKSEAELQTAHDKLGTYSTKIDEIQRKLSTLSAPSEDLTAAFNRLKSLYSTIESTNTTDADKIAAYKDWAAEIEHVNSLLAHEINLQKDTSKYAFEDAKKGINQYYSLLTNLTKSGNKGVTLTDLGWKANSSEYESLASALNSAAIKLRLIKESMQSLPVEQQTALMELLTNRTREYELVLGEQAAKEHEAAAAAKEAAAAAQERAKEKVTAKQDATLDEMHDKLGTYSARIDEIKRKLGTLSSPSEKLTSAFGRLNSLYNTMASTSTSEADKVRAYNDWANAITEVNALLTTEINLQREAAKNVQKPVSQKAALDQATSLKNLLGSSASASGTQAYKEVERWASQLDTAIKNANGDAAKLQQELANIGINGAADFERVAEAAARLKNEMAGVQKPVSQKAVIDQATSLKSLLGSSAGISDTQAYRDVENWANLLDTAIKNANGDAEKLQQELASIGINGSKDFERVAEAAAKLRHEMAGSPMREGTQQYDKALRRLDEMQSRIQKNASAWSAARNGKSSQAYADYLKQADAVDALRQKMAAGQITAVQYEAEVTKIGASMARNENIIRRAGEATRSMSDRLKGIASRLSAYFGISQIIMYSIRAVREAASASIQLERSFAQLKIVTGATDAEMVKFKDTAVGLAKDLGKSVSDVAGSIEVFSRLGYSLPDASELAKYATVMANVAAVDTDAATTGLTSIIKGFDMDVENAEHVSDVLVKVGQEYAVSAGEMMTAFEKSGAALNATGTSFEKSAGLIAAANAAVQDASVVGTALKTVSARIRGSKTDLEELGENTEDLADGFSKYAKELKGLTGFDIMNGDHTFKDLYDIMGGISKVWDELSDTQRARVSEILGGTRQLQVISSILGNWSDAVGAYNAAMNSAGEATRANDIYMSTAEAHINQMKAAFQEMGSTVFDSSIISFGADFVSFLLNAVSAATKLVDALGGVKTIIAFIATANIGKTISWVTTRLPELLGTLLSAEKFKMFYDATNAGISAWKAYYAAISDGAMSLKGVLSSTGKSIKSWFSGLSGFTKAGIGVTAVLATLSLIHKAVEKHRQSIKDAAADAAASANEIQELYNNYQNLNAAYKDGSGSVSDMISSRDELIQRLETEGVYVKSLIGDYADYADAVSKAVYIAKEADWLDLKREADTAKREAANDGNVSYSNEALDSIYASSMEWYKSLQDQLTEEISKNGSDTALAKSLSKQAATIKKTLQEAGDAIDEANKQLADIILGNALLDKELEVPDNVESFKKFRESLIEKINGDVRFDKAGFLSADQIVDSMMAQNDAFSQLYNEYQSELSKADEIAAAKNRIFEIIERGRPGSAGTSVEGYMKGYVNSLIGDLDASQINEVAAELEAGANNIEQAVWRVQNATSMNLGRLLLGSDADISEVEDVAKEAMDLFSKYAHDISEMDRLGVSITDTIFGNIDTNDRQVITWTQEQIDKFHDALYSFYNPEKFSPDQIEADIKSMIGQVSTVLGSENTFPYKDKKISVAFSPILQTENGPEVLDYNTVSEYIYALFDKAGDDLSKENLLRLDTQGLEFDGRVIKNILADVGETAKDTSEMMHFTGKDGSLALDYNAIEEFAQSFGVHANTILDYLSKIDGFNLDLSTEKSSLEALNTALSESASSTGLTAESVAELKKRYQDLADFDPEKLFERTQQGTHLNATALKELESEYEGTKKAIAELNLNNLVSQYEILSAQIRECDSSQVDQIASLSRQRDAVLAEIQDNEIRIQQYYNLTSAYNKWVAAQSQTGEKDNYEAIGSAYKELKKTVESGWEKNPSVDAYLDLLLNPGKRTGDNKKDFEQLSQTIEGTKYSIIDFFQFDGDGKITTDGLANFLDAIQSKTGELGEEIIGVNEAGEKTFDLTGDKIEKVANALGISTDLIEIFERALIEAGWDVKLESMFADIDERIANAKDSITTLKEAAASGEIKSDVDINVNVNTIEDANTELEKVKTLLGELRNEDGTFNIDDSKVQAALALFNLLLEKRAQLELGGSIIMDVELNDNASTNIGHAITLLQQYRTAWAELQIAKEQFEAGTIDQTQLDTAQQKVDNLFKSVKEDKTIKTKIGIDPPTEEELAAAIDSIKGEEGAKILMDAGIGEDEITTFIEDHSTATVTFDEEHSLVDSYLNSYALNNITKTIHFKAGKLPAILSLFGVGGAQGTAFAGGTAHANGDWSVKRSGRALVGEVGPEMIVRNGKFFTVGDKSAEFANIKKGDIIFNAEQTRQILKNGKITNGKKRGVSYLNGTAYWGGSGGTGSGGALRTNVTTYNAGNVPDKSKSNRSTKSTTAEAKKAAKEVSEAVEDQLKKLKEEIDDILAQFEFDIFMAEKHNASSEEIIAIYKRMQQTVHEQAEKYRKMGVDENNEYIRDLKKQWWEYEESIREARKKEFDEWVKDSQFAIEVMEHDEDGVDKILDSWRTILRSINDEIAYYSAQGYDITSDEIQDLMKEAWDAEEQIEDILDSVLDKINDDIDKIQDVYKTFRTAAEEWDSSNYLTLDTLQEIIGLGVEYMACLRNENGALMINRQKIAEMLAAKAQELAIQGALNYVRKIGIALQEGETAELNRLLNATVDVTSATWGLVNANLAFLNLSRDQYDAAVENIDRLHSLANNVSKNILDSLKADGATSSIEDAGEGLEKIIDYTKDLIKHEHDDMAKALDDQLDKYKQIVDEKKKSLDLTKSELDYNKDISNRTTEIAKLQAQADALARDNSREAQLKRAKILEEIAKKQEELEEKQRDHSIDAQKEALDKQVENYEESIGKQKEELEKEISSEEKLYQLALKRLEESGMSEAFMDQLLAWNYEYGNSLNTEIVDAWDAAKRAVEAYGGSVKEALSHHGDTAEEKEIGDQVGVRETFDNPDAYAIARAMEANSLAWFSASSSERKRLEAENAKYASQLQDLGLYRQNGAWYREDGSQLYALDTAKVDQALAAAMKQNSIAWWTASPAERTQLANKNKELAGYSGGRITNQNGTWVGQDGKPLYTITAQEKEGIVHQLVAMMKSNSGAWASADATERKRLSEENVRLANSVGSLLGTKVTRGDDGVWMINGEKLYDKYHSGGVVGGGTIKDRERFALLNKGEMVLSDAQKQSLEHLLAVGQMLRDKSSLLADSVFGGMVNNIAANSMKGIRNQLPGEINKPTQIVHVDASLTVSGAVDDDVLRVIKRHPSFVAEQVAKVLV